MRCLANTIKMDGFKQIEVFQHGSTVHFNGNFSLPKPMEFKTPEEAKAFVDGLKWAVGYYNGEVHHHIKEIS